jgi:alpha-galactosidase
MNSLLLCYMLVALSEVSHAFDYRYPTPPMGWNTYNYYNCKPSEDIVKSNAKGLVDLGFANLGYTRITPDCGWPAANRTASCELTWNATLFSSGFVELGSFLHGLGLKFGVYSGGGVYQCGGGPGSGAPALPASLAHGVTDADTFTSWGVDYLKYDNCWTNSTLYVSYDPNLEADPSVRFRTMTNALNRVNRSIEYEICQWGTGYDIGYWATQLAETWRVSDDIATEAAGGSNFWGSMWRITNEVVPYVKHTGPGKYPDMDMLMKVSGVAHPHAGSYS